VEQSAPPLLVSGLDWWWSRGPLNPEFPLKSIK